MTIKEAIHNLECFIDYDEHSKEQCDESWDVVKKSLEKLQKEIENLKCCGNCAEYQDGFCFKLKSNKHHDAFCSEWKYDNESMQNRLKL